VLQSETFHLELLLSLGC